MEERLNALLARLRQLSPMPADELATQEQLDAYKELILELDDVLTQDNDPRAIEPLIASFGLISGFGLYETTANLLMRYDDELLIPHLIDAVQHGEPGSRAWSALMLGWKGDRSFVPYVLPLLSDPEEYVRADAVLALSNIGDPSTREAVARLQNDPSEEVRDAVEIALEDWQE
jgi:HEAT repeat protein